MTACESETGPQRTGDGPVYCSAVLEFDRDRLIVELHLHTAQTGQDRARGGNERASQLEQLDWSHGLAALQRVRSE